MEKIRDVAEGDRLSAGTFNTVKNEVYRLSNLTVEAPLEMTQGPAGPVISFNLRISSDVFWAEVPATIDGDTSGTDEWLELEPTGDGSFIERIGGRNGTTLATLAFPVDTNGTAAVMIQMPGSNGATTYYYFQESVGQYQGMCKQMVAQNVVGWDFIPSVAELE